MKPKSGNYFDSINPANEQKIAEAVETAGIGELVIENEERINRAHQV